MLRLTASRYYSSSTLDSTLPVLFNQFNQSRLQKVENHRKMSGAAKFGLPKRYGISSPSVW